MEAAGAWKARRLHTTVDKENRHSLISASCDPVLQRQRGQPSPTLSARFEPDVQSLGSLRLPVSSPDSPADDPARDRCRAVRQPGLGVAQPGRLARQGFRGRPGREPPRHRVLGRPKLVRRPVPRSGRNGLHQARDAGHRHERPRSPADRPARDGDRQLHAHARPPLREQRRHRLVRGRRARRDRRGIGPADRLAASRDRSPATGLHDAAHGLRARRAGFVGPVGEGPAARRDRLVAARPSHPHRGLRLARRGGPAAPRGRPRDSLCPRARLRRRATDGDERLRPQRLDDARARAGDRLLAVHREPLPGGACPWAHGRGGRGACGRDERQGGDVFGCGRRDRPVRSVLPQGACPRVDRSRRRARRPLLGLLRAHVPARCPGDARAECIAVQPRRAHPADPAQSRHGAGRQPLGGPRPASHGSSDRRAGPCPRRPLRCGESLLPPRAGSARRVDLPGRS